jgi:hypothetical protein
LSVTSLSLVSLSDSDVFLDQNARLIHLVQDDVSLCDDVEVDVEVHDFSNQHQLVEVHLVLE